MKLRVLTLKNEEAEVEVEKDEKIYVVKKKICEQMAVFKKAESLKIIHSGEILLDNQTLEDYPNIHDNDKIVVIATKGLMRSREKAFEKEDNFVGESIKTNKFTGDIEIGEKTMNTGIIGKFEDDTLKDKHQKCGLLDGDELKDLGTKGILTRSTMHERNEFLDDKCSSISNVSSQYDMAASVFLTGDELHQSIHRIVMMGFEKDDVLNAMRAAFNNPDRAIEYLMNGIPTERCSMFDMENSNVNGNEENMRTDNSLGSSDSIISAATNGSTSNDSVLYSSESNEQAGNNQSLRNIPLLQEFRIAAQSNPQIIPNLLSSIAERDPGQFQLILQNQEAFIQMLQEPDDTMPQNSNALMENYPSEDIRSRGNNDTVITLTNEEMEAVQGLESLGFSRDMAIEAYFACEKNMEMAANYLFENMNDYSSLDDQD